MYAPQVLKLQWLNKYVITFLLKNNHNSKSIIKFFHNLTGFLYPYDCCAPTPY